MLTGPLRRKPNHGHAGNYCRGVTVISVPLLVLITEQLARLNAAVQYYGSVNTVHLNKISAEDPSQKIIPKMRVLPRNVLSTLVFLCLSQYLAKTTVFSVTLSHCNTWRALRLVGIDKAHLYTIHGHLFCNSIHSLRDTFFARIFVARTEYTPLFLAMTAMMTTSLLRSFSELTKVDRLRLQHHLRSSP